MVHSIDWRALGSRLLNDLSVPCPVLLTVKDGFGSEAGLKYDDRSLLQERFTKNFSEQLAFRANT